MRPPRIRPASVDDAALLHELFDGNAVGHPAENHPRSLEDVRRAFFGPSPIAHILIAERDGRPIGYAAWRPTFDVYWGMFGGEGFGLYVRREERGRGVAVCLIARVCAEVRSAGGRFLVGSYGDSPARFYERVAVGRSERSCHLSSRAFQAVADLAGSTPRQILGRLPDRELNF